MQFSGYIFIERHVKIILWCRPDITQSTDSDTHCNMQFPEYIIIGRHVEIILCCRPDLAQSTDHVGMSANIFLFR